VRAAGAVLGYCERSRVALQPGLLRLVPRQGGELMRLDPPTGATWSCSSLSVAVPAGQLLDRTRTPMGRGCSGAASRSRSPSGTDRRPPLRGAALVTDRARREELRKRIGAVPTWSGWWARVQGLATRVTSGPSETPCAALPPSPR